MSFVRKMLSQFETVTPMQGKGSQRALLAQYCYWRRSGKVCRNVSPVGLSYGCQNANLRECAKHITFRDESCGNCKSEYFTQSANHFVEFTHSIMMECNERQPIFHMIKRMSAQVASNILTRVITWKSVKDKSKHLSCCKTKILLKSIHEDGTDMFQINREK